MTEHGRRRKRSLWPPTLSLALMFALAALTGILLKGGLDVVLNPAPDPAPTVTEEQLIADGFADAVRGNLTTLDPALDNQGIKDEALAVCSALSSGPVEDVYYTHEVPVQTGEDAVRFFAMSVAWQCPEHMTALAEIRTP